MGEDRMNVEYDEGSDILYIKFRKANIVNTISVAEDAYMDLDEEGRPVGIEIWRASENVISPLSIAITTNIRTILEKPK